MAARITKDDLTAQRSLVNRMMGLPDKPYKDERDEDGRLVPNVGAHTYSKHAGGWRLERMTKGGGSRDISPRLTKKEMYLWMRAYIEGIDTAQREAKG